MKYTDGYLAKAGKLTTMGNVAEKFAKLTETQVTKPINLSELNAKVDNAIATAKKWEVVNFTIASNGQSVSEHSRRIYNFPQNIKNLLASGAPFIYQLEGNVRRRGGISGDRTDPAQYRAHISVNSSSYTYYTESSNYSTIVANGNITVKFIVYK